MLRNMQQIFAVMLKSIGYTQHIFYLVKCKMCNHVNVTLMPLKNLNITRNLLALSFQIFGTGQLEIKLKYSAL